VDEPSGGDYYGGKVAGPVFAKVASEALRYLGVPGEALVPVDAKGKPLKGAALERARKESEKKPKLPPIVGGDDGEPAPVETESEDESLEPGAIVIPNFAGMSVGRALDEARKLRLQVEITGSGQVI